MSRTYYDVLGIDTDATRDEIRDAYREKVKEYHPDVSDRDDAEERFKRVKRAETVLTDPEERSTYDRLGHDAYVDGDEPSPEQPTEDEVRWAAAQAARSDGDDAGGRSAGWRDRERRARRTGRAAWFWNDAARDDDGPFDDPVRDDPSQGASTDQRSAPSDVGETASTVGTAADARPGTTGTTDHAAAGSAPDGWGGERSRSDGQSVHEWKPEDRNGGIPRPQWTQDDVVLLLSSFLLYPLLLVLSVTPTFPTIVRVAIGICAIALAAFLLPRPSFGLPVFGSWSVFVPALLLGFGISPLSAMGLVTLGGVWLPLLYSIAVAMVLVR